MRIKLLTYIVASVISVGALMAQNSIESCLDSIEVNNTGLRTLRDEYEAMKLLNKTDIYLPDPDVEFAYLWGRQGGVGNRVDLSATQEFDLATISGARNRVANQENRLIDIEYKQQRINTLLQAKKVILELIYNNTLLEQSKQRNEFAKELLNAYERKMNQGDANALELNKARINLSTSEAQLSIVELTRESLLMELQRLNGGKPVTFNKLKYEDVIIPEDFDDWYEQALINNPYMQYAENEVSLNKEKVRLSKAMGLPKFNLGYKAELAPGEHYNGFSAGISIPLWSNKNRVKQARMAVKAAESKLADARLQFLSSLSILHRKAIQMQKTSSEYNNAVSKITSSPILEKALNAGQISLLDYIMETGIYYDAINQALNAEKDYQIALAELQAVEL